eukprot:CAMPEP_0175917462 /NCGR_PEP_ID=MMETSP0108-20121206/11374_1 /TAXON_ID=195067 ORGANISM="Goniomonas pacifica, Strain CCMP1869" /NCGR_SAMPLE_ID=MMETSP0108 /ASSEMBLY_ACC=CAM_ASM_000204 /LENGTH=139 /DNA_ID=CAMNT_0017240045 /DNA_START=197 /DNA_END=616 /DNA_ORIENTATION=-
MAFVGTTTCAPVAWASGGSTAPRVVLGPLLATWTATKFGCVTAPAMGSATITRNATVLGVGAAVTAPLRRKATSYSSSSAVSSSRSILGIYKILRHRRKVWLEKEKRRKTRRKLRAGRKGKSGGDKDEDRKKSKGKSIS